ncbi:MAG: hypothetical protein V1846_04200 [Candidatus Komeilibacteria bacterium]
MAGEIIDPIPGGGIKDASPAEVLKEIADLKLQQATDEQAAGHIERAREIDRTGRETTGRASVAKEEEGWENEIEAIFKTDGVEGLIKKRADVKEQIAEVNAALEGHKGQIDAAPTHEGKAVLLPQYSDLITEQHKLSMLYLRLDEFIRDNS